MNKRTRQYLADLEQTDLSIDMACLNILQETPFRVNTNILEILKTCWNSGEEWAGLPTRVETPLPHYQWEEQDPRKLPPEQKAEFRQWCAQRRKIRDYNRSQKGKRLALMTIIEMAEFYTKYPAMYWVWRQDFRGRKYSQVSLGLNPQGTDYTKALIEFANPSTIKHPDDATWLAYHGANLWGIDKEDLTTRELWAYLNGDNAISVAEDPLSDLWWTEADEPWQFLAWCFDWANYMKVGMGAETRTACAADGSANGLQHMSAIQRDLQGAIATNLLPLDKPSDIYRMVVDEAIEWLSKVTGEKEPIAKDLIEMAISRSAAKRSVMTRPYSATRHSSNEYVMSWFFETLEETPEHERPAWAAEPYLHAKLLADAIWFSIDAVVESSSSVMTWIKKVAKIWLEAGHAPEWITPTGLLVRQLYFKTRGKRVKTHIDGSVVALERREVIANSFDRKRHVNGSAPNFIHSLDAAHLAFTVLNAYQEGVTDFAMIHDSFATKSPEMPVLVEQTRQSFHQIYKDYCPLENWAEYTAETLGVEVPPPPPKGEYDLNEILKAEYFFS